MDKQKRKDRSKLISAMSYAVDVLAVQALMDAQLAIKELLNCDDRVWDELSDSTIRILDEGLGITRHG